MDKNQENVVDLFSEELEKKDKKLKKKIEKEKKKELKQKKKKEKALEKQEDIEFAKKLEEMKDEKDEELKIPDKDEIRQHKMDDLFKTTRMEKLEQRVETEKEISEVKHPFLNALLVIFSIILFVITGDYLIYNVYTNYVDLPTMVNSVLLSCMVLFYLLSFIIKKSGPKKFFELLSIICIGLFMSYHLFIA